MATVNGLGHSWRLTLTGAENNAMATYTTTEVWKQGNINYDLAWDLTSMPAGIYTLRINNVMEWGQPKLLNLTLDYDGELPAALPAIMVNDKTIICRDHIIIYDITGRNVTNQNGSLPRGTYIVRSAGTATKVVVK